MISRLQMTVSDLMLCIMATQKFSEIGVPQQSHGGISSDDLPPCFHYAALPQAFKIHSLHLITATYRGWLFPFAVMLAGYIYFCFVFCAVLKVKCTYLFISLFIE